MPHTSSRSFLIKDFLHCWRYFLLKGRQAADPVATPWAGLV
jgi:hypothetical protein